MPTLSKFPDFSHFIGKKLHEEISVDEIVAKANAGMYRIIEEGSAVTLDFRIERVNIYIDSEGNIIQITMG